MSDTPSDALEAFSAGLAIPVPLASIERELASLWRLASRNGDDAGGSAVTRACLWNLIVYIADESGFHGAKRLVDEISPRLPARVLVLKTDRSAATTRPRAWIEANWHKVGGGGRQIGSEELTIEGNGGAVDDLAPVVRALLVPDVPTAALWWGPSPDAGSALDVELLSAADRIIVGGDGEDDLGNLGRLFGDVSRFRAQPIALAWLRLGPWRQLLASLFDPPAPIEDVRSVERVEIVCPPERAGAALLFLGWLASRLGWSRGHRVEAGRYTFNRSGDEVGAEITLQRDAADPIAAIALYTGGGEYSLARHEGAVILNTPTIACRAPLVELTEAELWLAALSGQGRDPLFTKALGIASQLAMDVQP